MLLLAVSTSAIVGFKMNTASASDSCHREPPILFAKDYKTSGDECVVRTCISGYSPSTDGTKCNPITSVTCGDLPIDKSPDKEECFPSCFDTKKQRRPRDTLSGDLEKRCFSFCGTGTINDVTRKKECFPECFNGDVMIPKEDLSDTTKNTCYP